MWCNKSRGLFKHTPHSHVNSQDFTASWEWNRPYNFSSFILKSAARHTVTPSWCDLLATTTSGQVSKLYCTVLYCTGELNDCQYWRQFSWYLTFYFPPSGNYNFSCSHFLNHLNNFPGVLVQTSLSAREELFDNEISRLDTRQGEEIVVIRTSSISFCQQCNVIAVILSSV